ncbi:MAG TPA: riboflavin synthase [Bryobacteraceae bacterium]|nr:riboflavin synthase [Bryobacteraceae bacterium]
MFTGIVEEVGEVRRLEPHAVGARLEIACNQVLSDASTGVSIAVNGVCLTAVEVGLDYFSADLAPETLNRSNLGSLAPGSLVNLERPLALSERLSGHLVQGHVDGTAELVSLETLGDGNWWLRVRIPAELDRYLIHKGSVTLDGISLTVAALDQRIVSVAIIPHTYEVTNLRGRRPGDRINVEVDMIARYVEKLLHPEA